MEEGNKINGNFVIIAKDNEEPTRIRITSLIGISEFFKISNESLLTIRNDKNDIVIDLKDQNIKYSCLQWIKLKYDEHFDIQIDLKHIESFCSISDFFQISSLQKECDKMIASVFKDNKNEDPTIELKEEIIKYISLINIYEFLEMSKVELIEYIHLANFEKQKILLETLSKKILLYYCLSTKKIVENEEVYFQGFMAVAIIKDNIVFSIESDDKYSGGCFVLSGLDFKRKRIIGLPLFNDSRRHIIFENPERWGGNYGARLCINPNESINTSNLQEIPIHSITNKIINTCCIVVKKQKI